MSEKNIIYMIFILIVLLFPPLMKLLTRKKLGSRHVEQNENVQEEDDPSSIQTEIPRAPQVVLSGDGMNYDGHSEPSNVPIKPKMF